jgi:hypothetical protein
MVLALLGAIRLGLWLLPFPTLLRLLSRSSQVTSETKIADQTTIGKVVWAVNVASRYMPGNVKCLVLALTTQILMSRCGHSPKLRIGVAKGEEGQFEAHAWVENQGQVVIGNLTDLSRFTPMPSFEGDRL